MGEFRGERVGYCLLGTRPAPYPFEEDRCDANRQKPAGEAGSRLSRSAGRDARARGPAETIASFDQTTGKLTIDLSGGDTVSGTVTDETRIELSGDQGHHGWSGDDHRWEGRTRTLCGHGGRDASTDDLVPGAAVDDAVLVVADGRAAFVKVELAPQTSAPQASS